MVRKGLPKGKDFRNRASKVYQLYEPVNKVNVSKSPRTKES